MQELKKNTYWLSGGIKVDESVDLNDYIELGNYYCWKNDTAETIQNCPTSKAFTLKVEKGTGAGYPCQTLREFISGKEFYRYYDLSLKRWSIWNSEASLKVNAIYIKNNETAAVVYDTYSSQFEDLTWYCFSASHSYMHPKLGGGVWYVEGYKTNSLYEWQEATSYNTTSIVRNCRSKNNGVWNEWTRVI